MADAYLAISEIASDNWMQERVAACATQQTHLGTVALGDPWTWMKVNRYLWASSPDWGAAWDSALAGHPDDPDYEPGRDSATRRSPAASAAPRTRPG
jgi:hypothetical protein